mgnify:CR=1 FL=1
MGGMDTEVTDVRRDAPAATGLGQYRALAEYTVGLCRLATESTNGAGAGASTVAREHLETALVAFGAAGLPLEQARCRLALTGTPVENGLGDLWAILDFTNPGLVGTRPEFIAQLQGEGEAALRALNGILVFRRTKSEPEVAAELPDRIDELDHCTMTPEQIGLYQAVLDGLVADSTQVGGEPKQGAILAAITALKQICNHPAAYQDDGRPLAGSVARAGAQGGDPADGVGEDQ